MPPFGGLRERTLAAEPEFGVVFAPQHSVAVQAQGLAASTLRRNSDGRTSPVRGSISSMIWDVLSSISTYRNLWPALDTAIDYIEREDLNAIPLKKLEIAPGAVTAVRQEYATRPVAECKWEAHRLWADIQLVLSGQERFGYAPIGMMTGSTPYNPEKDVEYFQGDGDMMLLVPGRFGILFAHDVHLPCAMVTEPEPVVKIVFKLRLPKP